MVHDIPRIGRVPGGRLALLTSLTLHGFVGLVLWSRQGPAPPAPAFLDTRVPDLEIDLLMLDEPGTLPSRITLTPPTVLPGPIPELPSVARAAPAVAAPPSRAPTERAPPAAGGSGTAAGGVTTTFFQLPARGRSVVYVIDCSASMGANGRLTAARQELLASLRRLPAGARFQVIAYNRFAEPLRVGGGIGLLDASDRNKHQAAALLAAVVAEGGTEHLPALRQALALQPDVIYFLTDADDLKPEQVRAVTALNRARATIHALELTLANRDRPDMPLHLLARLNGGRYQAVPPPGR